MLCGRLKDELFQSNTLAPPSAYCNRADEMKIKTKREREAARKKKRDQVRRHRKSLNEDMRTSKREGDRKRKYNAGKEKTSTPKGLVEQRQMYRQKNLFRGRQNRKTSCHNLVVFLSQSQMQHQPDLQWILNIFSRKQML